METYSSLNSSYLSGLQFTSQTLSASLGGSISILVELPPQYGGVIYRCLASASGTGPTPIDFLYVPLTDDALYQRTYAGNFPPFGVIHPQGTLNARGGTRIGLQANPNQIPQAMVGRTFHLAVVLTTSTGNVYFSTGAGAISITL